MTTCERCERPQRPGLTSCEHCGNVFRPDTAGIPQGTPPPWSPPPVTPATMAAPAVPPPARPMPMPIPMPMPAPAGGSQSTKAVVLGLVAAGVVVLIAILVNVVAVGNPPRDGETVGSPATTYVAPPGTVTSYLPPVTTTTFSTPTSTVVPDDDTALLALRQQAATDSSNVEATVGYWIPQLSAKKPGMVVGGVSFGYSEIWQDFLTIRLHYPEAKLLWSGSYSSFRYKDFWITVLPEEHDTGESVNEWCDYSGIVKDDCYAKRLSHSSGYEGNTLVRK
ncbi:MAG TPA: hypothetical protein VGP60_35050 [Amycolatopsis sp.]|nr:hypothetical protein [Amycolatopsis sp.]